MTSWTKNISKLMVLATLVFAVGACSSKKKSGDADVPPPTESAATQAPQIDSTPMNFDAAGSDSGKISGLETIHFEYDKAALTAEAKKKLQANVDWIKGHSGTNVQVEGHCDARGSIEYNLSLGERRAQAVKNYLVGLGVSASRLTIISYGKEKPVAMGDSEADYMKNRRANFVPISQ